MCTNGHPDVMQSDKRKKVVINHVSSFLLRKRTHSQLLLKREGRKDFFPPPVLGLENRMMVYQVMSVRYKN